MATQDYVLQRCVRRTRKTSTWQTICLPVSYREGLAQLAAVADHPRPHRLLEGVPEASRIGFTVKEAAWQA